MNLLPPQEKDFLKKEEKLKVMLVLEIVFSFFLIFLFMCLLATKIILGAELEGANIALSAERENFIKTQPTEFQNKVVLLSQDIDKLDNFYKNQINVSEASQVIAEILPEGVYLTNFTWQKSNKKIEITGFAPQRDNLFELQRNLREKGIFENIDFPQSNWIKPNNIEFLATFNLK